MSEYKMSHTGAELDEAISKVLNGYILPIGSTEITENGEYDIAAFIKAIVNVPKGVYPIGNLTDALIVRSSGPNGHNAEIPAGYYVDSTFNISEWKSGNITGSGTAGGSFTIPYSSIGFIPTVAAVLFNSTNFTTNMVLGAFSWGTDGKTIYRTSSGNGNAVTCKATINSNGVTFSAPASSIKFQSYSYRWFAVR